MTTDSRTEATKAASAPARCRSPCPPQFDAGLYFIGRIRTPWKTRKDCPKNARAARETGAVCTIEVDPRWAQALTGVETCSHLIVLYWMDQARRDLVVQAPAITPTAGGTFALRSPVRPNPIALSVVRARARSRARGSRWSALDCLDGTPLLDIKPYFATTDFIPDATVNR